MTTGQCKPSKSIETSMSLSPFHNSGMARNSGPKLCLAGARLEQKERQQDESGSVYDSHHNEIHCVTRRLGSSVVRGRRQSACLQPEIK